MSSGRIEEPQHPVPRIVQIRRHRSDGKSHCLAVRVTRYIDGEIGQHCLAAT
jgi:hypothetical protein